VLADELTELGRLDSAVVVSFDDAIVEAFHQMAPTVEVSPGQDLLTAWVLSRTPLPDYMRVLQPPDVFGEVDVLANTLVADSHAAGYQMWVWPNSGRETETAAGYERLLALGIDAINAADPAVATAVIHR
jgi:glycerophosphoryl diester phosphodiesterase